MIEALYQILSTIGYSHPLHPAITHVPVGLSMAGFIFELVARILKRPVLAQTARHCAVLALLAVPPTVLLGYMDWQHFYGGAWLFPLKLKLMLAGLLFVFLSVAVVLGLNPAKNAKYILMVYGGCLAAVIGLGYFGGELVYGRKTPAATLDQGLAGAKIFKQRCAFCHAANSTETKIGPGLKGLFKLKTMPVSGWPVSAANVRKQLKTPYKDMPAFADLSEKDMDAVVVFLKTL
jgi:mono/diheme cytochrome c family protein